MGNLKLYAETASVIASIIVASMLEPAEQVKRLDRILSELIYQVVLEEKERAASATATQNPQHRKVLIHGYYI